MDDLPDGVVRLPPGRYAFEIVAAEKKISQASEREFCMLKCQVIESVFAGATIHKPVINTPNAEWVWQEVLIDIYDPRNLGVRFVAAVGYEDFHGKLMCRLGRLEKYRRLT